LYDNDAYRINDYDRAVKNPKVRTPACFPPSPGRMGVVYPHREVDIRVAIGSDSIVQVNKPALKPQIVTVERPKHDCRNHRYDQQSAFRFQTGEGKNQSGMSDQVMDDLLANPAVEVIGIYTPDHLHAEHVIKALRAGKHVVVSGGSETRQKIEYAGEIYEEAMLHFVPGPRRLPAHFPRLDQLYQENIP